MGKPHELRGKKVRSLSSPASRLQRQRYRSAAGQKRGKHSLAIAHEIIQRMGREWWVTDSAGRSHLRAREDEAARRAFAERSPNEIRKDGWLSLGGCSDFCQLFTEEARKRGVKVKYLLTGGEVNDRGVPTGHTMVKVFDNKAKKWKILDPKWFGHPYVRRFMYEGAKPTTPEEAEFAKAAKQWRREGLLSEKKGDQTHIHRVFAGYRPDLNMKLVARTTKKMEDIPDIIAFLATEQKVRNERLDKAGKTDVPRHRLAARNRLLQVELEQHQ